MSKADPIFLTLYALINTKTLKEESRLTRESLEHAREETKRILDKIAELIAAEGQRTREAIRKA